MANEQEIKIPDIGGASNVDVIELLVKEGDKIDKETPLITLESDKASMEIPSPDSGIVHAMKLKVGDKVSEGDVILTITKDSNAKDDNKSEEPQPNKPAEQGSKEDDKDTKKSAEESVDESTKKDNQKEQKIESGQKQDNSVTKADEIDNPQDMQDGSAPFATPAVRRIAREFGVNLNLVKSTGVKGRITKEDVQAFVKDKLQNSSQASGLPGLPTIDFSKFGEIEISPLNKIKKLTGSNLHASWVNVPHVTQFDEADITALEDFRKSQGAKLKDKKFKLTILGFVIKIVAKALEQFPEFNSSLENGGENLILKKYFNIGFAVDTPNGLVVPVLKNVNKLSVLEIAEQMSNLSSKARDKGLSLQDMSGGCFTVSSLGGIGGTQFTPIINAPEVAILGLSRAKMKPQYINGEFQPRLMLPLSLSYDHRVIDGAQGARFIRFLAESLEDIRQILM